MISALWLIPAMALGAVIGVVAVSIAFMAGVSFHDPKMSDLGSYRTAKRDRNIA